MNSSAKSSEFDFFRRIFCKLIDFILYWELRKINLFITYRTGIVGIFEQTKKKLRAKNHGYERTMWAITLCINLSMLCDYLNSRRTASNYTYNNYSMQRVFQWNSINSWIISRTFIVFLWDSVDIDRKRCFGWAFA